MPKAKSDSNLALKKLREDPRALAKAATLIDTENQRARELITPLFSQTGKARLVGITGPPGAGKSTLVNQITRELRKRGERVGIIAVDPSSPYSHGAILGDRIRLVEHYSDPGVFIRSVATRGKLGGLARGTLEMALLLDATGFDTVLIETVGVGQDEVDIGNLADVTVVVLVPGLGDDVQAIKAGIVEIADVLVVNKSDLAGADRLEEELRSAQTLSTSVEPVPIVRVVASDGIGVTSLLRMVEEKSRHAKSAEARIEIWSSRLREMLRDSLLLGLSSQQLREHAANIVYGKADLYQALDSLREGLLSRTGAR